MAKKTEKASERPYFSRMKKRPKIPKQQKVMGRPPHQPTELSRQFVRACAILDKPQSEIGQYVGCNDKTLRKHYRAELDAGRIEADVWVAQSIVDMATGGALSNGGKVNFEKANAQMARFYAASRMGWKETTGLEHSGADGGAIKIESLTTEQLERLIARLEGGGIEAIGARQGGVGKKKA